MIRYIIPFLILLFFDFYVFRAIRKQFRPCKKWIYRIVYLFFWLIPAFYLASPLYFHNIMQGSGARSELNRLYFGASFIVFYLPKLIIFVFQTLEDILKFLAWIAKKRSNIESRSYKIADGISRSLFISRLGLIISGIPFASLIYSIVIGRFNFQLNKLVLYFDHLPKAFDGFKIVQFSDLHAGSLIGQQNEFKKAMQMINEQNADIIVFTGDLVNDAANELDDWIELLSTLKAKNGKFSILGNHDYGDYYGSNKEEKISNLYKLKQYYVQMGFNLMLNDAEILEKDGQQIALLGVENWAKKHFPRKGRLDLAMEKAKEIPFKILLSHDPTHWDYQVLEKTDIALTLSGHTHGLQMVLNIGEYSWSPISYKYKRWKGLYTENNQHLYVNIGLGYIDFPGRIGADPEITVFELRCKS